VIPLEEEEEAREDFMAQIKAPWPPMECPQIDWVLGRRVEEKCVRRRAGSSTVT